jgi:hypothetical protein
VTNEFDETNRSIIIVRKIELHILTQLNIAGTELHISFTTEYLILLSCKTELHILVSPGQLNNPNIYRTSPTDCRKHGIEN